MDLYQRQQFDFFLQTASDRFVERLTQRFRGAQPALDALLSERDPQRDWLREFVDAVYDDFLLSNVDGACFVLRSLAMKRVANLGIPIPDSDTVEEFLVRWSKVLFATLLKQRTLETLEQQASYQPVQLGES